MLVEPSATWRVLDKVHIFMYDRMCLITSTVHPLPSMVYCCVAEHSHLYQSGIVCKRAASVGVMRRTISSRATSGAWPACAEHKEGMMPSEQYTRFCWYGCLPPLSPDWFICRTSRRISKLFCSHAFADSAGDLWVNSQPLFLPRGR